MSKQESRRGNSALPTGQPKRGPQRSNAQNAKSKSAFETIPSPSDKGVVTATGADKLDTLTAGFPQENSVNAVKGGHYTPNDDQINRGYVPNKAPVPSTTVTSRVRLREGIQPGRGDQ